MAEDQNADKDAKLGSSRMTEDVLFLRAVEYKVFEMTRVQDVGQTEAFPGSVQGAKSVEKPNV